MYVRLDDCIWLKLDIFENHYLNQLNSKVHKKYEPIDFQNYMGAMSLEEFAREMSLLNSPNYTT
ncbi:hypothetical protein JMF89_06900 [Clostridiaceae bacterium UIB06]|uniref:Uncharacterized protein n=1 Tax=Clostridium thailandense TaxID=2794346 RepID=A0A949TWP6_9CLOT|nr:hypothetical protein [Clostridium thailandense]MBV7273893.1 hypothetical protein [Clostridium thailandense]MCH5136928.1 hypothetical protein [Clostridiaceae bacterium UIB06]